MTWKELDPSSNEENEKNKLVYIENNKAQCWKTVVSRQPSSLWSKGSMVRCLECNQEDKCT